VPEGDDFNIIAVRSEVHVIVCSAHDATTYVTESPRLNHFADRRILSDPGEHVLEIVGKRVWRI
jgi:hypothetical protein